MDDARRLTGDRDGVTRVQLPSPTCFDVSVDRDRGGGQLSLCIGTAVDQIGELHELSEPDGLIPNRDVPDGFRHGRQASALASRP
jgi:hypothetical protein